MVIALLEHLLRPGACALGQLSLRREEGQVLILGPGTGPDAPEAPADPETFRQWIRQTDEGRYRPLSGARTLRGNWFRACADLEEAASVVDLVYPLALRHLALGGQGRLAVTPWDDVVRRQRGMYLAAGRLNVQGQTVAREVLCTQCVRRPVWEDPAAPPGDTAAIPCPEPCGVLLALCRMMADWEERPPAPAKPDPRLRFAEFEAPGNPVREACLVRWPEGA